MSSNRTRRHTSPAGPVGKSTRSSMISMTGRCHRNRPYDQRPVAVSHRTDRARVTGPPGPMAAANNSATARMAVAAVRVCRSVNVAGRNPSGPESDDVATRVAPTAMASTVHWSAASARTRGIPTTPARCPSRRWATRAPAAKQNRNAGSQKLTVKVRSRSAAAIAHRHAALTGRARPISAACVQNALRGASRRTNPPASAASTGSARYQETSVPRLQMCSSPGRSPTGE